MPITEIAFLRLRSGKLLSSSSSNSPSSLAATLRKAKHAQDTYSHHPVHFFAPVESDEDPSSIIYLLGGWDSVATHVEDWIPSSTNRSLMALLRDEIEVCWMFHVDVDQQQRSQQAKLPFDAPALAIGRYFAKDGKRGEFQERFDAICRHHAGCSTPRPVLGGWKLDKESIQGLGSDEQEEFVLFSGRDDVTRHVRFAGSESFHEFDKLRDLSDGAEVRHVVKLTL